MAAVDWKLSLVGVLIGALVGATGMGGGSLMTPILVLLFGFKPSVAIGTDILHGAIFKSFGAWRHHKLGTINGRLVAWMLLGSAPMSLIGVSVATMLKHHYGDGVQTTLNGRPARCRPMTALAEATLLTSDPLNPARHQDGPAFERLQRTARLCRTWGDGYGYLLVATGQADVMLDPIMNPWDIAALVPVIRGAGGLITDWNGGAAWPARSTIASATPELHAAVLRTLKS